MLIILLALIVGTATGSVGRGFVAIDRCLDRGSAWDASFDSGSLVAGDRRAKQIVS